MYSGETLLARMEVFESRKKPAEENGLEQGRHGGCYYHEI